MVRVADHLVPGTLANQVGSRLSLYPPYTPTCSWPDDTLVQWGNGIYPPNAFFEAFPTGLGFIRGDAETVAGAEEAAFAKFQRYSACDHHVWSRWHPTRGTYFNGLGWCRKCGASRSNVFKAINSTFGRWRRPISKMELNSLQSYEEDHELNAIMDRKYPDKKLDREKHYRSIKARFKVFGVDESRLGFFGD